MLQYYDKLYPVYPESQSEMAGPWHTLQNGAHLLILYKYIMNYNKIFRNINKCIL